MFVLIECGLFFSVRNLFQSAKFVKWSYSSKMLCFELLFVNSVQLESITQKNTNNRSLRQKKHCSKCTIDMCIAQSMFLRHLCYFIFLGRQIFTTKRHRLAPSNRNNQPFKLMHIHYTLAFVWDSDFIDAEQLLLLWLLMLVLQQTNSASFWTCEYNERS